MVNEIWKRPPSKKSIPNDSNARKVDSLGIFTGNLWDTFINKDKIEYI